LRVQALKRRVGGDGSGTCPEPIVEHKRYDSVYDLPPPEKPPPPCPLCGKHHVTIWAEVVIHNREDFEVFRNLHPEWNAQRYPGS
jgi:hypothetical protein